MTLGEKCLTCDIETPEGNKCTYVSNLFSTDLSYYAMTCSGPDPAITITYRTGENEEGIKGQDNEALRQRLQAYELPLIDFFHVPVGGGFEAAVKMQVPPNMDENKKYPMIVRVYGGPGSVRINSAYSVGYHVRK